jgi:nucleoside-diphosphate-sugar epimerase
MWNYTDAEDVADAHILAYECASIKGHEVFLLSAPNTRYNKDTLALIQEHWGEAVQLREGLEGNNSIISSKKAQTVLGWKPKKLWDL